jgi:hypothetical protein
MSGTFQTRVAREMNESVLQNHKASDELREWNFAVVGQSIPNLPRYIGFTEDLEGAKQLAKSARNIGWQSVAIFDPSLKQVDE